MVINNVTILMEDIDEICSELTNLQVYSICSIRIMSLFKITNHSRRYRGHSTRDSNAVAMFIAIRD